MMDVENPIGRLLTASFSPPFELHEMDRFAAKVRGYVVATRTPVLVMSDARAVIAFPQEISDRMVTLMRADNPRIERHAMLIGGSSIFGLQIENDVARVTAGIHGALPFACYVGG